MIHPTNNIMLQEARKARHNPHPVLQILIFIAVLLVTELCVGIVLGIPLTGWLFSNPEFISAIVSNDVASAMAIANQMPEWIQVPMLYATIIVTLLVIVYCCKIEGRSLRSMGFARKGWLKSYLVGFAIGAVMLTLCVGIAVLSGTMSLSLSTDISALMLLLFLGGFILQGMSEEVLMRGYFMVSLANRAPLAVAVGISSVFFSLLHLGNPGFTFLAAVNLALFGLLMALYVLRTDNLWGACALHSSWNFVQGNIFGVRVSGNAKVSTLFASSSTESGALINGGSFGLEGGLIVTVVLAVSIVLILLLPARQRSAAEEIAA